MLDKLAIYDGVLPSATVNLPQCFSLIFFDPPLLKALLYYIVLLYSISPSILSIIYPRSRVFVSFPTTF